MYRIDDFIDFKRGKGLKASTLKSDRTTIEWAVTAAERMGLPGDPGEWTAEQAQELIGAMGHTDGSRQTIRKTIRQYREYIGRPLDIPMLFNKGAPHARWIDAEQLDGCIEAAPDQVSRIIMHLGGCYGLRRGEMAALRMGDIRDGLMTIHGKGHGAEGKVRTIDIPADDPILGEYLRWRADIGARMHSDCDALLVRVKEGRGKLLPMPAEAVGDKTRRTFRAMGIDASTHSLRREFITELFRDGTDLVTIMRIVGHEDPKTTTRYIKTDRDAMRTAIGKRIHRAG